MQLQSLRRAAGWRFFHTGSLTHRPGATPLWAWGAPLGVFVMLRLAPVYVPKVMALLVVVVVVVLVDRRPTAAIKCILVVMPFHQLVVSGLYRAGLPAGIVRPLGQWKEGLILGLLIAAVRKAVRESHRIDRLDALALAYVGLGVAYVLIPGTFVGDAVGASLPLETRVLGFRTDVLYVALFLAARHLRLDPRTRGSITRTFLVTATIVCAIAYGEYLFQDFWNTFWIDWLRLPEYRFEVLQSIDPNLKLVQVRTNVAGRELLRAGSVLFLPFAMGCYGALAAAVFADRLVRGVARRAEYVCLMIVGGAVLLTITRTAIFALCVVLVISLFRRSDSIRQGPQAARVRFALMLAALVLVAVPVAASLGIIDRFGGKDDYSSNEEHREGIEDGYRILLEQPLGRGLATSAGAGQSANVSGVEITESQFLQIGTQLGVLGLLLWVLVVIHLMMALRSADRRAPPGFDRDLIAGARTAVFGLFVAGAFLQIFTEFSLSWSTWILAGLAMGSVESGTAAHEEAVVPDRHRHLV